jgi:hypothetical protein
MNGIIGTQKLRKYQAEVEWYKKNKPEAYSEVNAAVGMAPYAAWMNDGKVGSVLRGGGGYVPYVDVQAAMSGRTQELLKLKRQGSGRTIEMRDGQGSIIVRKLDSMSDGEIAAYVRNTMSDKERQQANINGWYAAQMNPDLYTESSLTEMQNKQMAEFDRQIEEYKTRMGGETNDDMKSELRAGIDYLEREKARYVSEMGEVLGAARYGGSFDPARAATIMQIYDISNALGRTYAYDNSEIRYKADAAWQAEENRRNQRVIANMRLTEAAKQKALDRQHELEKTRLAQQIQDEDGISYNDLSNTPPWLNLAITSYGKQLQTKQTDIYNTFTRNMEQLMPSGYSAERFSDRDGNTDYAVMYSKIKANPSTYIKNEDQRLAFEAATRAMVELSEIDRLFTDRLSDEIDIVVERNKISGEEILLPMASGEVSPRGKYIYYHNPKETSPKVMKRNFVADMVIKEVRKNGGITPRAIALYRTIQEDGDIDIDKIFMKDGKITEAAPVVFKAHGDKDTFLQIAEWVTGNDDGYGGRWFSGMTNMRIEDEIAKAYESVSKAIGEDMLSIRAADLDEITISLNSSNKQGQAYRAITTRMNGDPNGSKRKPLGKGIDEVFTVRVASSKNNADKGLFDVVSNRTNEEGDPVVIQMSGQELTALGIHVDGRISDVLLGRDYHPKKIEGGIRFIGEARAKDIGMNVYGISDESTIAGFLHAFRKTDLLIKNGNATPLGSLITDIVKNTNEFDFKLEATPMGGGGFRFALLDGDGNEIDADERSDIYTWSDASTDWELYNQRTLTNIVMKILLEAASANNPETDKIKKLRGAKA